MKEQRNEEEAENIFFPFSINIFWQILKLVCYKILKSVFWQNLTTKSWIIIWNFVLIQRIFLIPNGWSSF